ncbi:hypothetical protein DDB_G0286881 [Dictyostelium discoideum AX4]|uniref:EGF-like domain-containing protein n=1 Tax=Dictyostelium discoideum TaxID=44689 RepID=Q54L60_DICDI|nr:hypothetical protein DDB_G0286881 [Dictyostelium discoideum AX4]EAL63998.1 hypothetical protein DDB_G0286881 [Dictyostelium discoideum AX4]|eukprot:XP_637503.1 hypothetical protein DDB_G0286881 [Dictyostelium discoideum AX4]
MKILVLLLFFSICIVSYSVQIEQNDWNLPLYTLNTTTQQRNYCGTNGLNIITCFNDTVQRITIRHVPAKKNKLLSTIDLICFNSLISIAVIDANTENNFLYGEFPLKLESLRLDNGNLTSLFNYVDLSLGFNNTIVRNQIKKLILYGGVSKSENVNIYFSTLSHFSNLYFYIEDGATITNQTNFNFINDLNETKKSSFQSITTYCSNVPSLDYNNVILNYVEFTYLPSFDYESVSNYSTYSNVVSLELNSNKNDQVYPFPLGLSKIPPGNQLTSLSINHLIEKPPYFIDLSNLDSNISRGIYTSNQIEILNAGNSFNIDGVFPFTSFPKYLDSFTFEYGNLSRLPDFENIFNENIEYIDISNNIITENITRTLEWPGRTITLYLRNNHLKGSIDESWCKFNLEIYGNSLSGEAPSCFVCHINSNSFAITGNAFSNMELKPPCTSVILNLWYDNSTKLLFLYGQDIGFARSDFKLSPSSFNPYCGLLDEKVYENVRNGLFCLNYSLPGPVPLHINITYPKMPSNSPVKTFEISAYNMYLPLINSVSKDSKTNLYTIDGQYFAYNSTVITVLVDSQICIVVSCNFREIKCLLSKNNNNNKNNMINTNYLLSVQIMNVSSNFNLTKCPNDCSGAGICDLNLGICSCNSNRIFDDCSGFKCIGDCTSLTNSECNFTIGKCECISGWEGDDCKTQLFCPNDCSGSDAGNCDYITKTCNCKQGRTFACNTDCLNDSKCNFTIGKCECIPGWEGDGCSIRPKCQNDCSGGDAGNCNYITKTCICKQGRALDDCSGFACNIDCLNDSKCNFTIGKCECKDGWEGDNCNTKQPNCPNNCSESGICDRSTLKCLCDSDRLFEDCSGLKCIINCNNNSICNNKIGKCECLSGWFGDSCENSEKSSSESSESSESLSKSNKTKVILLCTILPSIALIGIILVVISLKKRKNEDQYKYHIKLK